MYLCSLHQTFAAIVVAAAVALPAFTRAGDIEWIGSLSLPGNATDLSDLSGVSDEGTPRNQLGGFSAIAYSGAGHRYLVLPDRGPAGGSSGYRCRFHEFDITVDLDAPEPISAKLLATHMLTDERGRPFVGSASEIDAQRPAASLRFDPEGIRVGPDQAIYICDEYGPHLFSFDARGGLRRRFPIPEHFQVSRPGASEKEEHAANTRGRQTNRGFEGLAITPSGKRLYAMLQGPLLQDHPADAEGKRQGLNTRLYEVDLSTGKTRELVYVLDQASHGISEILAIDESRLLVLERDSKGGAEAKSKRLYEANLTEATDVARVKSLPATTLPAGVRPIEKRLFLDLLDEKFGLRGEKLPAKVEGIAFGPDLPDGRRLLIVCSDNDFSETEPSWIYAFAIGPDDFPSVGQTGSKPSLFERISANPRAALATSPLPIAEGLTQVDGTTIRGRRNLYNGFPARNSDGTVNVIVEIPAGTNAKWEVTKEGELDWEIRDGEPRIVNFLPYPGNYGMVPNTLSPKEEGGDGDALDVLILGPALPRGTVAKVHLIGVMKFLDRGEQDDKFLAVMDNTPLGDVRSLKELRKVRPGVAEVVHLWFDNYKAPGKMIFQGWGDVEEAREILEKGIATARKK